MDTEIEFSQIQHANQVLGVEGGYFAYRPSQDTVLDLVDIISSYPQRSECVGALEWHCTVMYSKVTGRPWSWITTPSYARITGFEQWEDHKGRTILVCMLRFPKAVLQHRNLAENGWQHSFHEYNPHINMVKAATHPEWVEEATRRYSGTIIRFEESMFYGPAGL